MQPIGYLTALAIWLAILATSQAPPAQQPSPQSPLHVEEFLGEVDDGVLDDGGWQVSPDGRRLAWRTKREKKWVMIVDGQPSPGFDDASFPLFSPDGKRLAFAVESNNKWMMVVDGKPGPEFDHLAERQVDSGHRGPWGNAKVPLLWFSPNSKHVVYLAMRGKKWFIVIDGRESAPHEDIKSPFLSPDGGHIAYARKDAGKWRMVVDGNDQEATFDEIHVPGPFGTISYSNATPPRFSPDGQRLGFLGRRKGEWFSVLNGKETPFPKGSGLPACAAFSKDLRRTAYVQKSQEKKGLLAVVDGQPGTTFDWMGCPVFSPDEKQFAFFANRGKANAVGKDQDQFVVAAGQAGPSFKRIIVLYFTPDSRMSYLAWQDTEKEGKGKVVEVTNGVLRDVTEHKNMQKLVHLAVSPDNQHVAYVLIDDFYALGFWSQAWKTRPFQLPHKKGRVNLFLDGKPFGKEYEVAGMSNPVFGPDSRRLAFAVYDHKTTLTSGQAIGYVVLDGQEGKAYNDVLSETLAFTSPNSVSYVARRENKFYRVTQTIQAP